MADNVRARSVFKYCCMKRGKQFEERRLTWGLYAQVVRESGILIPTFMRLTFIPGHCAYPPAMMVGVKVLIEMRCMQCSPRSSRRAG